MIGAMGGRGSLPHSRAKAPSRYTCRGRLAAVAFAWLLTTPVWAAERMVAITLPALPLDDALVELGRQTGVDILLSSASVGDRLAPPLRGRFTPGQALRLLLADSGLEFESLEGQGYVVRARRAAMADAPPDPVVLPELLIVGVRTQNVDQRRDPDGIQPYRVFERATLRAAQGLSADDFLQTWLTSNTDSHEIVPSRARGLPPSRSNFSFRDPTAMSSTLVLVDGRRMPAVPNYARMLQADIGPIPLAAIGRIETLGASSGALYGLGAVNGVVNLVIDRDYRGAEVAVTAGRGKGGDGGYGRFDARLGYSTPDGATALMVRYGQKRFNGVAFGDRDQASAPLDGALLKAGQSFNRPAGNGVTLFGVNGPFTVGGVEMLKTYIPADYDGSTPIESVLIANAGLSAPGLAPAHRDQLLTTDSRTDAVLFNLRQQLWRGTEAYVDHIYLASRDRSPLAFGALSAQLTPGAGSASMLSGPNAVELVAPVPYVFGTFKSRLITRRTTIGLVFDLPSRWRGGLDYAVGDLRSAQVTLETGFDADARPGITSGMAAPDGRPAPNPFGDHAKFLVDLARYNAPWATSSPYSSSRLEDMSLRASGPLMRLRGQDVMLSLTAQQLWEGLPNFENYAPNHVSMRTRSLFGELRAPLEGLTGIPGLEAQAAARRQVGRIRLFYGGAAGPIEKTADLYLLGAKVEPVPGLTLRAAYASGAQLPEPVMFTNAVGAGISSLIDPKRNPNQPISAEGWFRHVWGGSPDLRPDQTRTYSAGAVITSPLLPRSRLSVDYTRIEGRDLLVEVYRGFDFYIQNEDRFPGAVIRDPLTEADRLKGYTAGRIVEVRDLNQNSGSSLVEAVDIVADHALELGGGRLALNAALTWQPTLRRRAPPDNLVAKRAPDGGASEWRGALGARWSTSRFAASATMRYANANTPTALPERTTIDLSVAWELSTKPDAPRTELRLGVRNLLDRWSIDDPLQRRFEATLMARF